MDPQTVSTLEEVLNSVGGIGIANILEAGVYSFGAVGVAYTIAKHRYLKRKSDNETHPARMQAVRELMETEGFQAYLQTRRDLTEKIASGDSNHNAGYVDSIVKNSLGKFPSLRIDS
ncbi:MAG: hypothetical protein IIA87_01760 [Nanoarchaeota archaeon]|nr:hypothetical protein [Nanoarchaeota archaeon]